MDHHRASERDDVSRCFEEWCTISRRVETVHSSAMNHLRIQCNTSILNSNPRDITCKSSELLRYCGKLLGFMTKCPYFQEYLNLSVPWCCCVLSSRLLHTKKVKEMFSAKLYSFLFGQTCLWSSTISVSLGKKLKVVTLFYFL